MNAPFFIVGLPRSRTAWLANLLTYGPAFCLHDGLKTCERPEELQQRLAATGAEWPGDADTALPLFFPQIHKLFPQARYVFVERDAAAAEASSAKFWEGFQTAEQSAEAFARAQGALAAMRAALRNQYTLTVRFEDLDQYHTAASVWEYCVPQVPFNPLRWEMLDEMRVTVIREKLSKHVDLGRVQSLISQARPYPAAPVPVKGSENHPLKQRYYELLVHLCGGNVAALAWLCVWCDLTLTWDHCLDRDPLDLVLADKTFEAMVLDWPVNPFWREHGVTLRPVLAAAIGAWRHGGATIKGWDVYTEVPLAVALLLGGRERVAQFNGPLRELVGQCFAEHTKE